MPPFSLVLGTHNQKKRRELELLLAPYQVKLMGLDDFPTALEIEETGSTFQENAALKATVQARHLNHWVLGEDSGLIVNALGGAPGIYSARFAGEHATDQDNNSLLLEKLVGIPLPDRTASYICHMTLSDPAGNQHVNCAGNCVGRILLEEHGQAGFGYDPLFEIPEYHQTFGQLGDAVKALLSHRARANRKLVPELLQIIRAQN